MRHAHVSRRSSWFTRALAPALVFSLVPLGTAMAQDQSLPSVRVTRDKIEISSLRGKNEVRMTAVKGTVLEVFFVEGDRYAHRDSNWYWVLLPVDKLGNRPVGWIKGDDVELVPAAPAAANARRGEAPAARPARNDASSIASLSTNTSASTNTSMSATAPAAAVEPAPVRPFMSDVVLNFEFGKSELTEDAKRTLTSAITKPSAQARYMSVALEGHADWVGSEAYNDRLGLARAESVRRYLADQLRIPADQISVVSYGEENPVASNSTREGRARNRRVVIRAGA